MTIEAAHPDPIAVSPGFGPLPPVYLGQSTDLSRLLWRAIRWALCRAGILRAQEEEEDDGRSNKPPLQQ